MDQAWQVGKKVFDTYEKAEKHAKGKDSEVAVVPIDLLSDQIVRKGRIITLVSAVHHQRHAPCLVLIEADKQGIPFRFTCLPVNNVFEPRRDILPFDAFLDLGGRPSNEQSRQMLAVSAFSVAGLFDLFEDWFEKCNLGASAIGEPRLFLPMYIDIEQYEMMKAMHLDEFFTRPVRILESIMAFTNDVSWAQNKPVEFGKDSYTQFATKCRQELSKGERGPLRLHKLALAYNYHLLVR